METTDIFKYDVQNNSVLFKKLDSGAVVPTRATKHSAGFDLYALEDTLIVGGAGNVLVRTGIAVELPLGTYGRIAMRSGLAKNQHLTVSAGVIDLDYTGEIGVLVSSTKIFDVKILKKYRAVLHPIQDKTSVQDVVVYTADVDKSLVPVAHKGLLTLHEPPSDYEHIYPVPTPHAYIIKAGERFAQLVVEKVDYSHGTEVTEFRRANANHAGFGSTGKN